MHSSLPPRLAPALAVAVLSACVPNQVDDPPPAGADGHLVAALQVEVLDGRADLILSITNAADGPVELVFPTGQEYDFVVRDRDRRVWRWSDDRAFTQAVRSRALPAGETVTYRERWRPDQPGSGRFTVVGRLTSSSHPLEQETVFELP